MTRATYPFTALVGLEPLRLALRLAAVDRRLSVLVRGDKGAGKSTAARALAELLPDGAAFVNLPIGATEDRLLGGLDIERTLGGDPVLKPGLLARADGGVLYVDEVNLLADHLADALLDAAASGVLVVEREGFSVSQPSDFVLLGSMNPEEGALRPQLLDRFALVIDVSAPADAAARAEVLSRRLAYDADPEGFRTRWQTAQATLASELVAARARADAVAVGAEMLGYVASRVAEHGVASLRADLAVVRAARARAALDGSPAVTMDDVEAVLPMALAHRAPGGPRPPSGRPPSPPPSASPEAQDEPACEGQAPGEHERVFAPVPQRAPRVVAVGAAGDGRARGNGIAGGGPVVGTRRTEVPVELDVRTTVVRAVARTGAVNAERRDLHERVRAPRGGTRFIFVVDSSGSHAVHERMRFVKGLASGLLAASFGRHDEIVVIGCRGARAEVHVEPTSSRESAERALEYLPTGGRTPLAHGLELAAGYVTDAALVVVITDGRANVPLGTGDAWADAQAAARAIRCPALVVDTEEPGTATGRAHVLADAMGARYARLDELDVQGTLTIVRNAR